MQALMPIEDQATDVSIDPKFVGRNIRKFNYRLSIIISILANQNMCNSLWSYHKINLEDYL